MMGGGGGAASGVWPLSASHVLYDCWSRLLKKMPIAPAHASSPSLKGVASHHPLSEPTHSSAQRTDLDSLRRVLSKMRLYQLGLPSPADHLNKMSVDVGGCR